MEDLIQEGCIKLYKAVATYDPSRGSLFLTYAGKNAVNEMKSCIKKAQKTMEWNLSYDPECKLIEQRINETIRDDEGRATLADSLVDPYAKETARVAIDRYELTEMYKALYDSSKRSRSFLFYHYGFIDNYFHSYYESARHFKQSCKYIRHVHQESLEEVRGNFSHY